MHPLSNQFESNFKVLVLPTGVHNLRKLRYDEG
jgi:hypothetical protein